MLFARCLTRETSQTGSSRRVFNELGPEIVLFFLYKVYCRKKKRSNTAICSDRYDLDEINNNYVYKPRAECSTRRGEGGRTVKGPRLQTM